MRIVDERAGRTMKRFAEMSVRDVFMYSTMTGSPSPFMKVSDTLGGNRNAVNMADGSLWTFDPSLTTTYEILSVRLVIS